MEYLRWILLVIAVAIVLLVYLRGRARRKSLDYSPLDDASEVPSFSASKDSDDVWKDGVGPVRVVHGETVATVSEEVIPVDIDTAPEEKLQAASAIPQQVSPVIQDAASKDASGSDDSEKVAPAQLAPEEVSAEPVSQQHQSADVTSAAQDIPVDDVVALYIVADRGNELKGEQILSASFATQMEYGDMRIFHRLDSNNKIVFSMANMVDPGWFDYEQMHELRTRGITLFTQLRLCDDAVTALDDMLVCAHTLANMLNGQLCDSQRQLLNETIARSLREKARYYYDLKHHQQEH